MYSCTDPNILLTSGGMHNTASESVPPVQTHFCTGCATGACKDRSIPLFEEHESTGSTNSSVSESFSLCSASNKTPVPRSWPVMLQCDIARSEAISSHYKFAEEEQAKTRHELLMYFQSICFIHAFIIEFSNTTTSWNVRLYLIYYYFLKRFIGHILLNVNA